MKKTLSQYMLELEAFMDRIDDSDTIPDDVINQFLDFNGEVKQKIDNWFGYMDALEAQECVVKREKEEIEKVWRKNQNVQKRLKNQILYIMQKHPDRIFAGTKEKFVMRKNKKSLDFAYELNSQSSSACIPDHVIALDERVNEYCTEKTFRVLDKAKLEKDLAAGKEIPFAKYKDSFHVRRQRLSTEVLDSK